MWRLCILVSLAAFAAPLHAQVELRWRLEPGDGFRIESVERHKQKVFTAGKMNESQHTVTTVLAVHVQKTDREGALTEIEIESVKVEAPKSSAADGELAKLMAGAVFQAVITPQGQIASFAGFDAFVKKVSSARGTPERLLRTLITEEGVKKGIAEYFAFLPPRPVSKNETWQREGFIPLGPLGSFQSSNKYTYEGKAGILDAISYAATLTYDPPEAGSDVFKVIKGDLQAKSAGGKFLFNSAAGRLTQSDRRMVISGELTIEVAGNRVDMSFEMDRKTTARLLPQP